MAKTKEELEKESSTNYQNFQIQLCSINSDRCKSKYYGKKEWHSFISGKIQRCDKPGFFEKWQGVNREDAKKQCEERIYKEYQNCLKKGCKS